VIIASVVLVCFVAVCLAAGHRIYHRGGETGDFSMLTFGHALRMLGVAGSIPLIITISIALVSLAPDG
jgi:hypothetical protein